MKTTSSALKKLEEIANSFEGVDKTYAIQSGREVRIIVKPEDVDDAGTLMLARDIVKSASSARWSIRARSR